MYCHALTENPLPELVDNCALMIGDGKWAAALCVNKGTSTRAQRAGAAG